MDNYAKTQQSISKLEFDIKQYVKQILPVLLPADATEKEKAKLEEIVYQVSALDVYNKKISSLYYKFHNEVLVRKNPGNFYELESKAPEMRVLELRCYLERTAPEMPFRNKALKCGKYSRYSGTWSTDAQGLSPRDPKRLEIEYAKRSWKKIDLENFLNYLEDKTHIHSIFTLRDFFHNGGNLENIPFGTKDFLNLQQSVSAMRKTLMEMMYNMGAYYEFNGRMYNPEIFSEKNFIEINRMYTMACESARKFIDNSNMYACQRTVATEMKVRKEQKLTEKELKFLSKPIIERFGKAFSELPRDERQHAEVLNGIYEEIGDYISTLPEAQRTSKEQYVKLMQDTYSKYMTQLKTHMLPIRLSYFPEDKEMYTKIVNEARKQQVHERKYGKPPMSSQAIVRSAICGLMAVMAGIVSADSGYYVLPALEALGAISALIVHKICEKHRLLDDVETRLGIRQKRIIQVRGFKTPSQMREMLDKEKREILDKEKMTPTNFVPKVYKAKTHLLEEEMPKVQFVSTEMKDYGIPENPFKPNDNGNNNTQQQVRRRRVDKNKEQYKDDLSEH